MPEPTTNATTTAETAAPATEAQRLAAAVEKFSAAHADQDAAHDARLGPNISFEKPDHDGDGLADGEVDAKADKAAPPAAEEPKKAEEKVAPQIAHILRETKRAEEKLSAQRAEIAKERAELDTARAEVGSVKDFYKLLLTDTAAALDKAGITDPKERELIAKATFYSYQPPEQQPADVKQAQQQKATDSRIAQLEAELKKRDEEKASAETQAAAAQNAESARASFKESIGSHIEAITEGAPRLRAVMASSREQTLTELYQLAESLFKERGEDPEKVPTPEELVEVAEQRLEAFAVRLGVEAKNTTQAAPKEHKAAKTITARTTTTPTKTRAIATTDEERLARAKAEWDRAWT
jgi:hypothetical protein